MQLASCMEQGLCQAVSCLSGLGFVSVFGASRAIGSGLLLGVDSFAVRCQCRDTCLLEAEAAPDEQTSPQNAFPKSPGCKSTSEVAAAWGDGIPGTLPGLTQIRRGVWGEERSHSVISARCTGPAEPCRHLNEKCINITAKNRIKIGINLCEGGGRSERGGFSLVCSVWCPASTCKGPCCWKMCRGPALPYV